MDRSGRRRNPCRRAQSPPTGAGTAGRATLSWFPPCPSSLFVAAGSFKIRRRDFIRTGPGWQGASSPVIRRQRPPKGAAAPRQMLQERLDRDDRDNVVVAVDDDDLVA